MILSNVLRLIFLCLGIFSLFNGIIISMTSNFNLGNILTLLLGIVLLGVGIFWEKLRTNAPRWLKITFFTLLAVVFVFASSLYFYGKTDNVTHDEDAIIVLGAGLRGSRPSSTLKGRLDAAYDYHKENPDALIVVSGGKGHDEDITEAQAMETYLIELGVPKEKIVKEEKSTSTFENFVFSKKILDGLLGDDYKIAYISNDYHVFRAGHIAKKAGFENKTHTHSNTIWHSILPGTLRECIGVMKYFVLGN